MKLLTDTYGRSFTTLRVSLLNKCNLGCVYCSAGDEVADLNKKAVQLPPEELLQLTGTLLHLLPIQTIRLTGGEPLLYPHLSAIASGLRDQGCTDIRITTNGLLLARQAGALREAGVRSVNVSLDALDEPTFFRMSRRFGLEKVLQGIEAAQEAGLDVKINTVVMKGINHQQVVPLLDFARERKVVIRFLEIMSMGHLYGQTDPAFFSKAEMLDQIAERYQYRPLKRKASATASYWTTDRGQVFGIIANESAPFCSDCNRLRIDSSGNLYGCLSSGEPVSVRGITDPDEWMERLETALAQKQPVRFRGSPLSMLQIGG